MKPCCTQVIQRYIDIIGDEYEGAALFCRESVTRLVFLNGEWSEMR